MFTQQAPALVRALQDVLQPGQVEQLTRALGNCQQPVAHRGQMQITPPVNLGRNRQGVYGPGTWNPDNYPGLVPNSGSPGFYEVGNMEPSTWNSGNQYASQFLFPTNNYQTLNQFLGGPQVYISNTAQIDNIVNQTFQGSTATINNINVQTINNQQLPGPAGPPGAPGQDGLPGAPGAPGQPGVIPVGQFRPIRYLTGVNPRVTNQVLPTPRYVTDAWVRPVALTFNADNCEVSFASTTAASTLVSKLQGAGGAPQIVSLVRIARDAANFIPVNIQLRDVNPRDARVFQQ